MIESDADRLAILSGLGGGPVNAPRGTFTGLLESEFVQVGEIPVDSTSPQLSARTSDVRAAGVSVGIALVIEGEQYIVRSMQNDRTGMTLMLLEGP